MFIFTYFLIIFLKSVISKLSFHFTRNITKDLSPSNLMDNLFKNDIITFFEIGNQKQKIPISIKLQNYYFYIYSSPSNPKYNFLALNQQKSFLQINNLRNLLYNENDNNTFFSSDIISFSNKKNKFNFLLIKNVSESEFYKSGILGLNIKGNKSNEELNFINQLKEKNLISSYSFSIKYKNENENEGDLIIGKRPDEYDNKYKINNLHKIKVPIYKNEFDWGINFDSIEYGELDIYKLETKFAFFEIELGIIVGTVDYKFAIEKNFFNKYIKENRCFVGRIKGDEVKVTGFKYYYCNEDVNISDMKNLTFFSKDLNSNFTFNYKDLFYNFNGKNYFLVIFPWYMGIQWRLGLPFFKKYEFVFNSDKKIIGVYDKVLEVNIILQNSWKNNLIILLFVIISFMTFFIYKIYIHKPRKIRANELIDNYEYIPEIIDFKN